ncbi:MAG: hypothetical protein ABJB47_08210 [Actinomycetota bacterium]
MATQDRYWSCDHPEVSVSSRKTSGSARRTSRGQQVPGRLRTVLQVALRELAELRAVEQRRGLVVTDDRDVQGVFQQRGLGSEVREDGL